VQALDFLIRILQPQQLFDVRKHPVSIDFSMLTPGARGLVRSGGLDFDVER
jgi:hypothetical protein